MNYNIEDIELSLKEAVKKTGASKDVFEGQRDSNPKNSMDHFIVVKVASSIVDMATHGRCTSRIEVFVKNLSSGAKNSQKFRDIFSKLTFPITTDRYIFDCYPSIIPLGNDGNGYHVQAIQIETIIKTN